MEAVIIVEHVWSVCGMLEAKFLNPHIHVFGSLVSSHFNFHLLLL